MYSLENNVPTRVRVDFWENQSLFHSSNTNGQPVTTKVKTTTTTTTTSATKTFKFDSNGHLETENGYSNNSSPPPPHVNSNILGFEKVEYESETEQNGFISLDKINLEEEEPTPTAEPLAEPIPQPEPVYSEPIDTEIETETETPEPIPIPAPAAFVGVNYENEADYLNTLMTSQEAPEIPLIPDRICLYEEIPSLREAPYDANADSQELKKAMKDEDALIRIICRRTAAQRLEIIKQYQQNFAKDLAKDVKGETSFRFQEVLVSLLTPRLEYLASKLHGAISGLGTKECVLIDILCTSSNSELEDIKATYHLMHKKLLVDEVKSDTSGYFQKTLVSLCQRDRSAETILSSSAVMDDANSLYKGGIKKLGTDEALFIDILTSRSFTHLREVFKAYEVISSEDIEKSITKEFSGDVQEALLAIVKCTRNRAAYFAERLRKSMKGLGTNDDLLVFILVSRCEVDLGNIKQEYERLYSKTLSDSVHSETSGDYRKSLKVLIGDLN